MSLSSSSLRALIQSDLNRTASETTVCSKRKIESCDSIISFKRQKTISCSLSKTHSLDIFSSTIIKHARIASSFFLSLSHLDQTSQSFLLFHLDQTSQVFKKKRERSRVEKTSKALKKKREKSRIEKTSEILKKKRERSRVEKTSKISKNKNERSRKLDQASKKENDMSRKRDRMTQKKKTKRSRKCDKSSKKKKERSQQIDFIRASNSNLDRKIAQIIKNTKTTRQHETILKRRLRERIDRKTRHARQCARVIRRDDTSFNTITQTSQSLRNIVSFSSRQDNSLFSHHSRSSVVFVQNSVDYRTCVRCDLLRSTNRFFAFFDVEYRD